MRPSLLPRFLLAVYVLLVAYATLYPLAGWRDPAGSALAFLAAPWPRYVTAFDLGANFLGYVPYGLLSVLAAHPALRGAAAAAGAVLSGAALSLVLESAQSFLPARIPSNLDVLANLCGAAAGALAGLRFAPALLQGGSLQRLRAEVFAPGAAADFCLTLLGLWLFAQLNPATLLFGAGDLRDLFAGRGGERHAAELFVSIEAVTTAANLVAVALLASAVTRPGAPVWLLLALLFAAALAVRTLAFAILLRAEHVLAWLTPGAQLGLAAGAAILLAAVLLMAATVLVNLAPPNPYFVATLKVWQQGHFLHFNGITALVSSLWPFAALGYLVWLASARQGGALR